MRWQHQNYPASRHVTSSPSSFRSERHSDDLRYNAAAFIFLVMGVIAVLNVLLGLAPLRESLPFTVLYLSIAFVAGVIFSAHTRWQYRQPRPSYQRQKISAPRRKLSEPIFPMVPGADPRKAIRARILLPAPALLGSHPGATSVPEPAERRRPNEQSAREL